jgi:hypothetical protein
MLFSTLTIAAFVTGINGYALVPRCDHTSCTKSGAASVTTPAPITTSAPIWTSATATLTSTPSASYCEKQYDECRSSGDPNEADCAAEKYACDNGHPMTTTWATHTVDQFVTYCPTPTSFVAYGTKTYTATVNEWITVTDCPYSCTISHPAGVTPTWVPGSINATSTLAPLISK